jgi:hypothetical protein
VADDSDSATGTVKTSVDARDGSGAKPRYAQPKEGEECERDKGFGQAADNAG